MSSSEPHDAVIPPVDALPDDKAPGGPEGEAAAPRKRRPRKPKAVHPLRLPSATRVSG